MLPEDASDETKTFTSSDKTIVTVTPVQGKVTAISTGTAKITVQTSNGKTSECTVTVVASLGG